MGPRRTLAIVASQYNATYVNGLVTHTRRELETIGPAMNVTLHEVPGAFEIPLIVQELAVRGEIDAIIALGVIIQGENYEIRQVFKASEHCCSWLARPAAAEQGGNAAAPAGGASVVEPPGCAAQGAAKPAAQARDWGDIEISFLSDERVEITVGIHTETHNYAEMGFASKLNGKPVLAWETLRAMAQAGGCTMVAANGRKWAEVEKRMQEIRKVLRQRFGLSADPLPFTRKTRRDSDGGYRTKFKLGCGPSFQS